MRRFLCLLICALTALSFCSCIHLTGTDSTPPPSIDVGLPNTEEPSPMDTSSGTYFPNTDVPTDTPSLNVTEEPDTSAPTQEAMSTLTPTLMPPLVPTPAPVFTPALTPVLEPTPIPTQYCNPYPTDPDEARLAEAGKEFMRKLTSKDGYANLNLKAKYGYPYLICINKVRNCITVYCVDEEGKYTRPFLSMICSGGDDTPLGIFHTPARYSWHTLMGPCYGQYCTRIVGGVLFHSVPYRTMHKYDLQYYSYNRLGSLVSHGCIRLAVNDAKWIYDNCPLGTTVVIYNDSSNDGPLGRPKPFRIDTSNIFLRGWDPTDPDRANPWGDEHIAGTTIRSMLAQEQFDYAMEHGLWNGSINRPEAPTPTPVITPTPVPTPTPTPTPTLAPTPTLEPSATPSDTDEPTPSDVPSATPTQTPTEEPSATPTKIPIVAPSEPPTSGSAPMPHEKRQWRGRNRCLE